MRSDMDVQREVMNELKWDPVTKNAEVAVSVRDGVVVLAGAVDSFAVKYAAPRAAERVGGVRGIADELEVRLASEHRRSDTDLAHQVVNALRWDVLVPDERIKARVENGWVWLEGEVEWAYQRDAAYRAVRNLTGVRGVSNLVAIKTHVSTFDVSARIKDALRRHAELDARQIEVEAKEGTVTLRGTVHSWAERREAEHAAWGAPGVTRVDDRLVVHA